MSLKVVNRNCMEDNFISEAFPLEVMLKIKYAVVLRP